MSAIREKNLDALRRTDPALAERLEGTPATDVVEVVSARNGEPVPAIVGHGRRIALHSLFDPSKEASRLADTVLSQRDGQSQPEGHPQEARECFLYFEGLGGGYQVRQALARSEATRALLLEPHPALLSELVTKIDLSDIFADPRVRILVDGTPEETADIVRATYLPGVMGPFLSIPLRARIDMEPSLFAAHRQTVRAALDAAADDYTVQSGFGHLWTRNILANLPLLATHPAPRPLVSEAIVTSAGPSLEERLDELARLRPGRFLIATDTSLPVLLAAGHRPDAVLTIDCQYLSYYHFLSGIPASSLLVAELAAPPGIVRRAAAILAVSSGHPLSRLAAAELGGILPIDTSGGNVGHAAVSLALQLGAHSVHLLGSDFSYPLGKPYARGSFLFDYFDERAGRVSPLEAGMTSLIYRSTPVERDELAGGLRFTTRTLTAYRDRFVKAFAPAAARIHPIVVNGLPIDFPETAVGGPGPALDSRPSIREAAPSAEEARRFFVRYREAVASLPVRVPDPSGASDTGGIDDQWKVFATLYPLIAHLRRAAPPGTRSAELISQAKGAVGVMLERVLMGENA